MTGMAQGRPEGEHAGEEQQAVARPPLPGPADETAGPMTIIPGPAAEDSPAWQPDAPSPAPATYGADRPAAYQSGGSTAPMTIGGFMSDVKRNGRWQVPAELSVVTGMSDVNLDLREAVVTSPVVHMSLYGFMTSFKIIVPPGVEVEWAGGVSLLSDEKADQPEGQHPDMWRLRVTHYGAMTDVRVRALAVGEKPTKKWWKSGG